MNIPQALKKIQKTLNELNGQHPGPVSGGVNAEQLTGLLQVQQTVIASANEAALDERIGMIARDLSTIARGQLNILDAVGHLASRVADIEQSLVGGGESSGTPTPLWSPVYSPMVSPARSVVSDVSFDDPDPPCGQPSPPSSPLPPDHCNLCTKLVEASYQRMTFGCPHTFHKLCVKEWVDGRVDAEKKCPVCKVTK